MITVIIGPYRIPVRGMTDEERKDARGLYYSQPRSIAIDQHQSPHEQADTLLHECIHAIWGAKDYGKRMTEESVANKFGTALADLFLANPGLLASIVGALFHNLPIVKGE